MDLSSTLTQITVVTIQVTFWSEDSNLATTASGGIPIQFLMTLTHLFTYNEKHIHKKKDIDVDFIPERRGRLDDEV